MSKYITQELARYWPILSELLAQYRDGTHTTKDRYGLYWLNQNNLFHRYGDKPAVIGRNGYLEWRQNGQRHRSHGPSVIRPNGTLEWWINDEDITQEVNEWLAGEEWLGTPTQIFEFQLRFG